MTKVRAWVAHGPKQKIESFSYELGPLKTDEVDIDVDHCGLCHSDYSVWANEWGNAQYPFVGGHEIVGRVRAIGSEVKGLKMGQPVGLGWMSRSDLTTAQSLSGDHNLSPGNEATILGRYGGFADIVRCQAVWAIPLPEGLNAKDAGPLFCGGLTVFNPMVQFDVKPTDKVGVMGIGGLGHLAIQFLNKWGCEVTAFTSSEAKSKEAKALGAHYTLDSRDSSSWAVAKGKFDFLISTVAIDLEWQKLVATLAPKGRLHIVGAVPNPIALAAFPMLGSQTSLSGSPVGSPSTTAKMLDFCARHKISPLVEYFPMSKLNEAMAHLEAGKPRYRIILQNDFPKQ